jgi:hypothetical protein
MLVPLLCGVAVAYGFTVLVMKRSILTEKLSRRGYHLSREYSVDPLELSLVRDYLEPGPFDPEGFDTVTAYLNEPLRAVAHRMAASGRTRLPVVDPRTGAPAGVITLEHLLQARGRYSRSDTERARHFELPWSRVSVEGG